MPPRTSFSAAEYDRRHQCILLHAGLYRLLLPACITRVFGGGKPVPHVYHRLVKDGLLAGHRRVLPGGQSCYTLSAAGCRSVNTPLLRAQLPEGPALDLAIGLSFFCHLGKSRRYRVEAEQVSELLGTPMPNNLGYVITNELGDKAKLMRAVSAASLGAPELVRTLRVLLEQTQRNSVLQPWVDAQQYGFAVLSPTTQTLSASEKAVKKSCIREACAVVVGLGPTAETLSAALKSKGK